MKAVYKAIVVGIITLEARLVLRRYRPKIIAITGSVGKTSAKEAIYHAIANTYAARKSRKSFNSEIGVPLTILDEGNPYHDPIGWLGVFARGLALILFKRQYPAWLVLEAGADKPGDIARVARWLCPDIAVITGVPDIPVHVEFFASADAVAEEKYELARGMRNGGELIVNGDDARALKMRERFLAERKGSTVVRYGFAADCEVRGEKPEVVYEEGRLVGERFTVRAGDATAPVSITGGLGSTHTYAALVACAVGRTMGMELSAIVARFSSYVPIAGRMRVLEAVHGATLLDDSYNASPAAVGAALDTLHSLDVRGRRIAILGDMRELGAYTRPAHEQVGKQAATVLDALYTVGDEAREIARAAREAGMADDAIHEYAADAAAQAGKDVAASITAGDIVLVKGSQNTIRAERASFELLADPSRAAELLPRFDAEWLRM